jgi:hypothetical protein
MTFRTEQDAVSQAMRGGRGLRASAFSFGRGLPGPADLDNPGLPDDRGVALGLGGILLALGPTKVWEILRHF